MPLKALIGPIAAATIVTAFWFAVIWRGHQHERRRGRMPRRFDLALGGYIATNGLALYLTRQRPLSTEMDLFWAAILSEAFGIVVTYGLVHAFVLSRGQPWTERAFPIAGSTFLAGLMFAALFTR